MIYHYTSIKTFALILEYKTIRFSRLDTVDDPEEYQFARDGVNPAKYAFVSCWTKSNEEIIPQWKMYGDNCHGVRIGFDDNLFDIIQKDGQSYLSEYYAQDYFILPLLNTKTALYNVLYVDNPSSHNDEIFKTVREGTVGQNVVSTKKLGLYKNKVWAFQKECRFKIDVAPLDKNGLVPKNYLGRQILLPETFIDLKISAKAFESMEVRLGPNVELSERIIVKALLQKYQILHNLELSVFAGKM